MSAIYRVLRAHRGQRHCTVAYEVEQHGGVGSRIYEVEGTTRRVEFELGGGVIFDADNNIAGFWTVIASPDFPIEELIGKRLIQLSEVSDRLTAQRLQGRSGMVGGDETSITGFR